MSALQPITLYAHDSGPNPWKVAIVLRELDVPYEIKMLAFPDMKKEPYESINPNGRVPAIEDPNTGMKLWESGAILEYLIATYDKDNKLSYPVGSNEYWWSKQWLAFQISGQGRHCLSLRANIFFNQGHPAFIPKARQAESITNG